MKRFALTLVAVAALATAANAAGKVRYFLTDGVVSAVDSDAAPVDVPKVRFESRQVQECYTDALGFQRCRMVTKMVPISEPVSAPPIEWATTPAEAVTAAPCPCVASTGSCPCAGVGVAASEPRPRLFFPHARNFLATVNQSRPHLFTGRLLGSLATRLQR